jgi:hypothetical protein
MRKFYKRNLKLITGQVVEYVGKCIYCEAEIVTESSPKYGQTTLSPALDVEFERVLGTNHKIPKRTRWEDIPSDLVGLLEEEKRLRDELEKKGQNGEDNLDDSPEETLAPS